MPPIVGDIFMSGPEPNSGQASTRAATQAKLKKLDELVSLGSVSRLSVCNAHWLYALLSYGRIICATVILAKYSSACSRDGILAAVLLFQSDC